MHEKTALDNKHTARGARLHAHITLAQMDWSEIGRQNGTKGPQRNEDANAYMSCVSLYYVLNEMHINQCQTVYAVAFVVTC